MSSLVEPSDRQCQRLQVLVSRIAIRTLAEWDQPFRRLPRERVLPHLAITNPRLTYSDDLRERKDSVHLLERGLSIDILIRMDGEAHTDQAISIVQKGLLASESRKDYADVYVHILAARKVGVDASSLIPWVIQFCQKAVERGEGAFAAYILSALGKVGTDASLLIPWVTQFCQEAVEKEGWFAASYILPVLSSLGLDTSSLFPLGTQVLQGAMEKEEWKAATSILCTLARAGMTRVWIDYTVDGSRGKTLGEIRTKLDWTDIAAVPKAFVFKRLREVELVQAWSEGLSDEAIIAAVRKGQVG